MNKMISSTAALAIAAVLSVSAANARDQIQVSGSSTVLPYAKIVAETFGETYPNFKTSTLASRKFRKFVSVMTASSSQPTQTAQTGSSLQLMFTRHLLLSSS